MNKLKYIIIGALMPIVLGGIGIVYIKASMPFDIWTPENRNFLHESFSPQKKFKIGVYNYDKGALGYTSVQVSIVKDGEQYPIMGNLLRDQYIESVKWVSENTAVFPLRLESELSANLTITIK